MTRKEAKELFKKDKNAYGYANAPMTKIDEIYDDFEKIENDIKNMRDIQKDNLIDGYMVGLYNGLELALATIENREPIFEETKELNPK